MPKRPSSTIGAWTDRRRSRRNRAACRPWRPCPNATWRALRCPCRRPSSLPCRCPIWTSTGWRTACRRPISLALAARDFPPPLDSISAMTSPSETLSPSATFISVILPAAEEGTSSVALSDSSVIRGCSFSTSSPSATSTSMTSTESKSPISGTLTSTVSPPPESSPSLSSSASASACSALSSSDDSSASALSSPRHRIIAAAGLVLGLDHGDHVTFGDVAAFRDFQLGDLAGDSGRHFKCRLVRLERDQWLFLLDRVALGDQYFDDFDRVEIADVRDLDFLRRHKAFPWLDEPDVSCETSGRLVSVGSFSPRDTRGSMRHRFRLFRIDAVFIDRVGDNLAFDLAFVGQRLERADRDPAAIDLEELA